MARSFIERTAKAALYRGMLRYGDVIPPQRHLTAAQKLKYFPVGLAYRMIDALSDVARGFGPTSGLTPCYNQQSGITPQGVDLTSRHVFHNAADVPNTCFTVGRPPAGSGDGKRLIDKTRLVVEIIPFAGDKLFFTTEEATRHLEERLGRTYRVPVPRIGQLLEELVGDDQLRKTGCFYHLKRVNPSEVPDKLALAVGRVNDAKSRFYEAVDQRIGDLRRCTTVETLWNLVHEDRAPLGFRGVYLFLKSNGFSQVFATSDRDTAYREQQEPTGVMKRVLEGSQTIYRISLGTDLKTAMAAFKQAGFDEVDRSWVEESLVNNGIGSIDLLRLVDEDGKPVGALLLRDPVYFGEDHQADVDRKLIDFAYAIGKTIVRLKGEAETRATSSASPKTPVPAEYDQERELEFWSAYSRIMHVFQGWRAHYGMISEVLKLLRVQNGQEIIVAGCGVGTDFLEFRRRFEESNISGVAMQGFDVTKEMVDKARENPLLQGMRDAITVQDWCQALDYKDGSASHVASILVLGYLMNIDVALEQTLRVLAPGGGFALAVTIPDYSPYKIFFKAVWHSLWDRGWRETARNVPNGWRCISYMRQIKNKIKQGIYRGFYPVEIVALLEKKGFVNVTASRFADDTNFVVAYGQKPASAPQS